MNKYEKGKKGEDIACVFLEKNGIKIIKKNYFTKYGEIDLIGIQNSTIIFIEVKLRTNNNFGYPAESINFNKKKKIYNAAEIFLLENCYKDVDCRFDVICLFEKKNIYQVKWFKNQYFD